jgi:hypothetical protein
MFQRIFEKYSKIKFYENPSPVGAELLHADGQSDMTTLFAILQTHLKVRIHWRNTSAIYGFQESLMIQLLGKLCTLSPLGVVKPR